MIVGVISDTHDHLGGLGKAVKIFQENQVEMIIHCGDWVSPFTLEFFDLLCAKHSLPVKSVLGNNKGDLKRIIERNSQLKNPIEFAAKEVFELTIGKNRAVVCHGHDKVILNALIQTGNYDVVFTGHSHQVRQEKVGKTLVLNPGATCFAVENRIIDQASVAIYDSTSNSARIITFK